MKIPTFNLYWIFIEQLFNQYWWIFQLRIWVINTKLSVWIWAHRIYQTILSYKNRMVFTTWDYTDFNIVAAESRHIMKLLTLIQFLSETQLTVFIISPRKNLCKKLLILLHFLNLFIILNYILYFAVLVINMIVYQYRHF